MMENLILTSIFSFMMISSIMAQDRLFCYYSNKAKNRRDVARMFPTDIREDMCTDLVYAFADVDAEGHTIKAGHEEDYEAIVAKKTSEKKVWLAVGGDNPENADAFAKVSANENARRKFKDNVFTFLNNNKFSGVIIHWQFPVLGGEEVPNYFKLIKSLGEKFQRNQLLSVALSGHSPDVQAYFADESYFESIVDYVDYFLLMSYDLFQYTNATKDMGIHAALKDKCLPEQYGDQCEDGNWPHRHQNQEWVIAFYRSQITGIKLIVGLPTYGRSYTIFEGYTDTGDKAKGPGDAGDLTEEKGLLSYTEICERLNRGIGAKWTRHYDERQKSIYAYHGDQWVGYDDTETITEKVVLARKSGVGGFFMWDVSLDDMTGEGCDALPFPLTRTVAELVGLEIDTRRDTKDDSYELGPDYGYNGNNYYYNEDNYVPLTRPPTTTRKPRVGLWDLLVNGENSYQNRMDETVLSDRRYNEDEDDSEPRIRTTTTRKPLVGLWDLMANGENSYVDLDGAADAGSKISLLALILNIMLCYTLGQ